VPTARLSFRCFTKRSHSFDSLQIGACS
jgi:hypothetical protein